MATLLKPTTQEQSLKKSQSAYLYTTLKVAISHGHNLAELCEEGVSGSVHLARI